MNFCNMFDYQLDRHCSKTLGAKSIEYMRFDYQLDRHCSKTRQVVFVALARLITS